IIYPTDTVYAFGCDLMNKKAVEKMAQIKGVKLEKANFSILLKDISEISEYTPQIPNNVFKILKRALPGPYTFILEANNQVPKLFRSKKKTIGIRIPENKIDLAIVEALGNPLITTSLHDDDEILDYTTDPELIYERYNSQIKYIIDGGYGNNVPSTIIDCSSGECEVIREGLGDISFL
ncbi:MAG TPA: threonylcarbamoyl-AMP synthase, partial [Flavobacteriales bacterium]|nr:threonylcarbamoyl-AMP synthase [Flavobacteriales bacterium]